MSGRVWTIGAGTTRTQATRPSGAKGRKGGQKRESPPFREPRQSGRRVSNPWPSAWEAYRQKPDSYGTSGVFGGFHTISVGSRPPRIRTSEGQTRTETCTPEMWRSKLPDGERPSRGPIYWLPTPPSLDTAPNVPSSCAVRLNRPSAAWNDGDLVRIATSDNRTPSAAATEPAEVRVGLVREPRARVQRFP